METCKSHQNAKENLWVRCHDSSELRAGGLYIVQVVGGTGDLKEQRSAELRKARFVWLGSFCKLWQASNLWQFINEVSMKGLVCVVGAAWLIWP